MNVFARCLLSTRLHPAPSILRSTRCRLFIPSRLISHGQRYASFRPNPQPDDERTEQERAADLIALKRRAAQARQEANNAGSEDRQLREFQLSGPDVTQYQHPPISWKPLFVGLGMCITAFLAAEAIDGRADAQSFQILVKSGWHSGTLQEAKKAIAARSISPLTLLDQFLGTDTVRWWATHSDGYHATVIVIATNAAVFLAWTLASRVPALSYRMAKFFVHFPGVTPSYTLLTSVFSHTGSLHFACNMIAFYSFGPSCFDYLTARRVTQYPNIDDSIPQKRHSMNMNSTFHSIAFFISCGICANLIPHYIRLLSIRSRLLMLSTASSALIPLPGLGASGALYSCIVVEAMAHPDQQIALIFLPFVGIPIIYGVSGMITLDTVGVLRGWRSFDHLCHLSGAAIGAGAFHYGPAVWYKAQSWLRGGKISSR